MTEKGKELEQARRKIMDLEELVKSQGSELLQRKEKNEKDNARWKDRVTWTG